ncbi:hypothetical protein GGF42_003665 [Coemansia sp. RSA 2424]|nr:hypothetical protein GGF42_003665 [Coemansia sp. RSA 2424]
MSALGVPTSRSLALVFTDRVVEREEAELGAVVTRLAPSWVRFGSFELPASRSDYNLLRELADYVIRHHYPELRRLPSQDNVYVRLLKCVVERTAAMVAAWQAVGFCHGVMNTDNMSILGLTIDYGPFAFLDAYDPDFICNHSDPTGRYAFREQPRVALWNLVRLAGPLSRLAGSAPEADASSEILDAVAQTLNSFGSEFSRNYTDIMRLKFGLAAEHDDNGNDMAKVVQPFLDLLERGRTDYTFAMRALCDVPLLLNDDSDEPLLKCHIDALAERSDCNSMGDDWQGAVRAFYKDVYGPRLAAQGVVDQQSAKSLSASMRLANPRHVLRNWVAQDIIEQAEKEGNVACVDQALELLTTFAFSDTLPEHLREMAERYAGPVPQWGEGLQCSCSS